MTRPISNAFPRGQDRACTMEMWAQYEALLAGEIQSQPVDTRPFLEALPKWQGDLRTGIPIIVTPSLKLNKALLATHAAQTEAILAGSLSPAFTGLCSAIEEANTSIAKFVESVIRGDSLILARTAAAADVPLEMLTFLSTYICRLVRQSIAESCDLQHGVTEWSFGYCPVCGMWPRMAHIDAVNGKRQLWCIGCNSVWVFPRLICPFCAERNQDRLGFLYLDDKASSRVYTCERCRRYIKTVTSDMSSGRQEMSFDVEYLSSSSLDMLAGVESYIQDFAGFVAFDFQDNAAARAYRQAVLDIR